MRRFLFTTLSSNDLGLLTRSLPIASELRNRGHEVAFCNPQQAPRKLIAQAGFDNLVPKSPLLEFTAGGTSLTGLYRLLRSKEGRRDLGTLWSMLNHMRRFNTAEIWNLDQFLDWNGMWNENYVRASVENVMKLIEEYRPDAVVDFWSPSACIAARATHKFLITVIQSHQHPQSRGFIWWKEPPPNLPTPVPAINTILTERDLRPIRKAGELFLGDLTLVAGIPETDPLPVTADVTYIGAVLWQAPGETLPDWITGLSPAGPLIWLYPGNPQYLPAGATPYDSSVITYGCIDALKDMPVQVVLSTGHQALPKKAHALPPNFRHMPFVPGLAMAAKSDLLIHHGGYGSCQTGLFTGTPALVIPTYSERESNARRIAAVGAGDFVLPTMDASGTRKHVQAAQVREKVERILSDPSYKLNAQRISKKLRAFGGPSYAADLMERSL